MHNNIKTFAKPPLVEVLCGQSFEALGQFAIPHVGLLWKDYQPEYSLFQELPPIEPVIESYEEAEPPSPSVYESFDRLPLPRFCFLETDRRSTVQVQNNRFSYSWRHTKDSDYPRFGAVYEQFLSKLAKLEAFVAETGIGEVTCNQYELTYINFMPLPESDDGEHALEKLLPQFKIGHETNFLPHPSRLGINLSYDLPQQQGRLHVTIQPKEFFKPTVSGIRLILTVRGFPKTPSSEDKSNWFALAREWIVKGFVDFTGKEIQEKFWGLEE